MLKKILCSALSSLLIGCAYADTEQGARDGVDDNATVFDGFLNLKTVHERDNQYPFGPKSTSAVGLNPVFRIGALQVESDFYYGRQFTFTGFCKSPINLSKMTGELPYFFDNYNRFMKGRVNSALSNDLDKAHFYRNYTRVTYANKAHDYRIVVGDTVVRNTIGFQQVLSGAGISIFRQGGDGSEINGGSPIVITRVSKVECKMGDEILCVKVLAPGLYTINDLPEEAKIPGVTVKISDQLSRSEKLKIRYFSGYDMPAAGKDDFDVTIVCGHKWDLESQHRMRYQKKPRGSTNYRYGYTDNITLAAGWQTAENHNVLDFLTIFATPYGKISPNVAYSHSSQDGTHHALAAGLYYELPENEMKVHFDVYGAVKEKHFSDLGKGSDLETAYNEFINKYFSSNAVLRDRILNSSSPSSSRQITARLYTDAICGIIPAFVFNGEWGKNQRLREYTLSMSTSICECFHVVLTGGLTYDDPSKGRNQRSPDRRLTAACCWNINSELSAKSTYSHYEGEKRRTYCNVTYTPEEIKGLELSAERYSRPGLSNPCFTVKYDGKFFNVKVDENITNSYEDKEALTSNRHSNRQRAYFGTSLSAKGFSSYRNSSFNVARDL